MVTFHSAGFLMDRSEGSASVRMVARSSLVASFRLCFNVKMWKYPGPISNTNGRELLSLGALRLLRSSCFALTQPDACGAGESGGVLELGVVGCLHFLLAISTKI